MTRRPPSEAERTARLGLSCVVEAGDPKVASAVALAGAQEVWQTIRRTRDDSAWGRRVAEFDADQTRQRTLDAGARYVVPGDLEWPESLAALDGAGTLHGRGGPPLGLWLRGAVRMEAARARRPVAIVGSRSATSYGERVAADLAAEFSAEGHPVISGGAFGIDAAAHRGALSGRGGTIAVLACGVDVAYPQSHHTLFEEIAETGLVVSELPPGDHPSRVRFLARNRLIAALSDAVVIVEAAARSGAKNTATWTTRCLRPLMAVPGPITSAQSEGCHALIRNNEAVLVGHSAHVLEQLGAIDIEAPVPQESGPARATDGWAEEKLAVFEVLPTRGGMDTTTVALRSGLGIAVVLALLGELLCEGFVRRTGDDRWRIDSVPSRGVTSQGWNRS